MSTGPVVSDSPEHSNACCAFSDAFTCSPVTSFVCHRGAAHVDVTGSISWSPALNGDTARGNFNDVHDARIYFCLTDVQ